MFERLQDQIARADERIGRRGLLIGLAVAARVALIALIPAVTGNNGSGRSLRATGTPTSSDSQPALSDTVPGDASMPLPGPTTTVVASVQGTQFTQATTTVPAKPGAPAVIAGTAPKPTAGP